MLGQLKLPIVFQVGGKTKSLCEVVIHKPDIEKVLHGICSPMLDVRTQTFMDHKQDLSASNRASLLGLNLFEGVKFPREITQNDVGHPAYLRLHKLNREL